MNNSNSKNRNSKICLVYWVVLEVDQQSECTYSLETYLEVDQKAGSTMCLVHLYVRLAKAFKGSLPLCHPRAAVNAQR